ncbi:MAG: quercetin dioxygenase-like cupin family protein [Arenicella sp.]
MFIRYILWVNTVNYEKFKMTRFSFFSKAIIMILTCLSFETSAQKDAISSEVEKQNAMALGAKGPSETHGIKSEVLAMIPLAREFDVMQAYSLRSRRITVAPGGVIAVHQHQSRPGILYMLEGEMTEHRNDSDTPLTRKQSDVSAEVDGLIHWWVNNSENEAVVYVVDIVATAQ